MAVGNYKDILHHRYMQIRPTHHYYQIRDVWARNSDEIDIIRNPSGSKIELQLIIVQFLT
jgi:hypothetical protein